jgi:dTDP-4-dehydrorhamnose 3,5-epimerase
MLFIPRGFAHGFYVISEVAEMEYKVDNFYSQKDESGIIWNDPKLKIKWPFKGEPILAEKDKNWPRFS